MKRCDSLSMSAGPHTRTRVSNFLNFLAPMQISVLCHPTAKIKFSSTCPFFGSQKSGSLFFYSSFISFLPSRFPISPLATHSHSTMSAANVPEGLKNITPFLQRAAQLQERDPVVSYYGNGCMSTWSRCKGAKARHIVTDEAYDLQINRNSKLLCRQARYRKGI